MSRSHAEHALPSSSSAVETICACTATLVPTVRAWPVVALPGGQPICPCNSTANSKLAWFEVGALPLQAATCWLLHHPQPFGQYQPVPLWQLRLLYVPWGSARFTHRQRPQQQQHHHQPRPVLCQPSPGHALEAMPGQPCQRAPPLGPQPHAGP